MGIVAQKAGHSFDCRLTNQKGVIELGGGQNVLMKKILGPKTCDFCFRIAQVSRGKLPVRNRTFQREGSQRLLLRLPVFRKVKQFSGDYRKNEEAVSPLFADFPTVQAVSFWSAKSMRKFVSAPNSFGFTMTGSLIQLRHALPGQLLLSLRRHGAYRPAGLGCRFLPDGHGINFRCFFGSRTHLQ